MNLLVIRHGIAGDRDEFARTGQDDSLRPLTSRGRDRMRDGARGLARLVPRIDVLATSPWTRAAQTAEIIDGAYDKATSPIVTDVLIPTRAYTEFAAWLGQQRGADVVAVVGHEPHLSGLVSWLLAGGTTSFVRLKKGSACCLDLSRAAGPGTATLLWLLTPAQLRAS